ncbi:MAG: ROK family protein [Clostridia bacterium]|nr:ROK family protein [Clostridia bacterium]
MEKRYFIGIDLGGTNIAVALCDEEGKILGRAKKKTLAPRPYNEIFDDMVDCAHIACDKAGIPLDKVESVGVGCPGSIDVEKGTIEYSNNLRFFDVPVVSYLEEKLHKKVYVENDANAAAWGEYLAGSGQGGDSLVMITLGTGVGGGIIIDGKLIPGAFGKGAELGHMVIVVDGEECSCGRRGCLEAYASATALIKQTKKAMLDNPHCDMWQIAEGNIDNVNGTTAFKGRDDVAKAVVDTYLNYVSEGVVDIVNLLQPTVVCIGGGISHEGESILAPMKKAIKERSYARHSAKQTEVTLATLGNDAGIIGAALLGR